jgi:hypothetical protein
VEDEGTTHALVEHDHPLSVREADDMGMGAVGVLIPVENNVL